MKWKTQNRQFQYSEDNIYSLNGWNKYYSRLTNTHTACHLSCSSWRWDTERSRISLLLCRAVQKGWRLRDGIRKERVSDGWMDWYSVGAGKDWRRPDCQAVGSWTPLRSDSCTHMQSAGPQFTHMMKTPRSCFLPCADLTDPVTSSLVRCVSAALPPDLTHV